MRWLRGGRHVWFSLLLPCKGSLVSRRYPKRSRRMLCDRGVAEGVHLRCSSASSWPVCLPAAYLAANCNMQCPAVYTLRVPCPLSARPRTRLEEFSYLFLRPAPRLLLATTYSNKLSYSLLSAPYGLHLGGDLTHAGSDAPAPHSDVFPSQGADSHLGTLVATSPRPGAAPQ